MWLFDIIKLSYEELFSYIILGAIFGVVIMAYVIHRIDKIPIKPIDKNKKL
jgi:hypothetical protein